MPIRVACSPPASAGRSLLTVLDYGSQPCNIGDLIIFMTGSLVAAEEAGAEAIDFCVLTDPARGHVDPVMAQLITPDNHHELVLGILPILQLNPRLRSYHVLGAAAELEPFLAARQDGVALWPERDALAARRYLFYDVFQAVHRHHARRGPPPPLRWGGELRRWVHGFLERHAGDAVPVSVNLRANPGFHAHRNSILPAWKAFFDACADRYPVRFLVTCAASEVDDGLRACRNVVYSKDHQAELLHDLALIRFSAFHLGAASGPAAVPIFGARPYHIVHCDMAPHLAAYGGALLRSGPAELRYAWASEVQTFDTEPETPERLLAAFERIWASRDWVREAPALRAALLSDDYQAAG